jgi:hypothetical protein
MFVMMFLMWRRSCRLSAPVLEDQRGGKRTQVRVAAGPACR